MHAQASTPVQIANLALEFTAADEATLTFSDVGAALDAALEKAPRSCSFTVQREFKHKPDPYVPPQRIDGNFTQADTETMTTYTGGTLTSKIVVTGDLIWEQSKLGCPPSKTGK